MIIGLTGGIGSGKTTVAALLAQKGAFVIDTDLVARDVVEPASPALAAIRREFGDSVINPDGSLDRAALARIIFHDEGKRAKLNELTHPEILKRVLALISSQSADTVIVAVVPLLFESGFDRSCDQTVAVVASPEIRRGRLQERDGITGSEVEARMKAQLPDAEYERRAAVIIRNESNLTALGREVDRTWDLLTGSRAKAQSTT
ncbi:MAG: dephospho-CoA kinase [Candidatus Eremiobacteraeota bacterium]|nr:dephospho-CoA kinase [Candidatus Eremiobacteraeota bacterium]MBV8670244.1 dephospho-CoA kinase [Candidatus Eremiobacteraeota bacterium]